jgi:hypothetical protein
MSQIRKRAPFKLSFLVYLAKNTYVFFGDFKKRVCFKSTLKLRFCNSTKKLMDFPVFNRKDGLIPM